MAEFKQLYIFVEGSDDERFINSIVKQECLNKYDYVKIIRYACKVPSEISKLISVIKNQKSSDYIFMCDMDARGDKTFCITSRKQKENEKFSNILEMEKILIVKEEIESWYLSGISVGNLNRYRMKIQDDTAEITKEEFRKLIPKKFDSVSDFMIEILKDFSLDRAITINKSLNYFFKKYL